MPWKSYWEALKHFAASTFLAQDRQEYVVKRPVPLSSFEDGFSWKLENILVLSVERDVVSLAQSLSNEGAEVSFRSLHKLNDIYTIPLEQFTMVIMTSGSSQQDFDVIDVGGTLRRADLDIKLVWASSLFSFSSIANEGMTGFCDINLRLPAAAKDLQKFLETTR